jgi:hypothetical protein
VSRPVRNLLAVTAALVGLLVAAAPASGSFHLMKIREISATDASNTVNSSYVEVQMYAPFQNLLHFGARLFECDASCTGPSQVFFPSPGPYFTDVPNGANQSTIVFGDTALASKDFDVNLNLDTGTYEPGGALCYVTYPSDPGFNDCVSWGTFDAAGVTALGTALSNDAGTTPGKIGPGLLPAQAWRRNISANCPTALDAADDTDTGADFAMVTPSPRPNSVTPTETVCGGGGGSPGGGAAAPPAGTPTSTTPAAKKCKKPKKRSASAAKKCKKKK